MLVSMIVAVAASTLASAQHTITLINNCNYAVPVYVDSTYSPVPYTGPQPGTIGPISSVNVVVPATWHSSICHNADGAKCADGVTVDSMAEFQMTTPGGDDYYLISNIHGFSIGQRIEPYNTACTVVECDSVTCPCYDANPPDMGGCATGDPVKMCASGDYTILYCP